MKTTVVRRNAAGGWHQANLDHPKRFLSTADYLRVRAGLRALDEKLASMLAAEKEQRW